MKIENFFNFCQTLYSGAKELPDQVHPRAVDGPSSGSARGQVHHRGRLPEADGEPRCRLEDQSRENEAGLSAAQLVSQR